MQRLSVLTFAAMLAVFAAEARAADTAPPAAPDAALDAPRIGRYTMVPADGGFVRLDTETGTVSHCRRESEAIDSPWRCAAIPEAVLGEPGRVEALTARVEALSAEVERLRGRLDAIDGGPSAGAAASPTDDPELDRALGFSTELMRRFFGLMHEMKSGEPPLPPKPIPPSPEAVRP
ncbi:hypothetical protein SAMN02745157_4569 [Kaistia soli DSM 19436]|uniref:Uncharacterized protein n=1 Tax=Kaistia soli DSM 19436 TaxID=1122133 RepID=A0A1M5LE36_9HYPH|nr:hypothetical protein [Kaistia soli]SHG63226.1 hypothetical protein SAMN02745157_4569 [Kaistia soli DSM 19436]